MKTVYIFLFCYILCAHALSQNFVANGGFEDPNLCTEYHTLCAPEAWISTTLMSNYYFKHATSAHSGVCFTGLVVGGKISRSFIRTRLLCGLRRGQQYRIEFFVRSGHDALDSVGVCFSATDFIFFSNYRQAAPAVVYRDTAAKAPVDTTCWKKISFIYTATGNEVFMTIGNFKKENYQFNGPADSNGFYYVYLDDVQLTATDGHELPCRDLENNMKETYDENERHEMLLQKVKLYRHNPPVEKPPAATVLLKIDTLIIPDILFATGSAKLNEESHAVLDSFSTALTRNAFDSLVVEGHTDSVGTLIYNMRLSADRANAVANYITDKAMTGRKKIVVRYHAYLMPVANNTTAEGRRRNRRVEIYLYRHG